MKTCLGCLKDLLKSVTVKQPPVDPQPSENKDGETPSTDLKEQKVKIPVEEPGKLEVPEGEDVDDLPESHFQGLIKRKGWGEISKALINLKVWNRTKNKPLSSWADNMQEKLAAWVEKQRKAGKKIE